MRLFILVMSHLDGDPDNWRYSGQASHLADLQSQLTTLPNTSAQSDGKHPFNTSVTLGNVTRQRLGSTHTTSPRDHTRS